MTIEKHDADIFLRFEGTWTPAGLDEALHIGMTSGTIKGRRDDVLPALTNRIRVHSEGKRTINMIRVWQETLDREGFVNTGDYEYSLMPLTVTADDFIAAMGRTVSALIVLEDKARALLIMTSKSDLANRTDYHARAVALLQLAVSVLSDTEAVRDGNLYRFKSVIRGLQLLTDTLGGRYNPTPAALEAATDTVRTRVDALASLHALLPQPEVKP